MCAPFPDASRIRLGSCAWSFEQWRTVFYPPSLPQGQWLEFYSRFFGAVEVDTTFYHPPAKHVVEHWFQQTPEHFRFAVRMPRQVTHENRLRNSRPEVERFLEALKPLKDKLACVLVQLPPSFSPKQDELALRTFLATLPKDIRFAVEFRHMDWHLPRIVHLFENHGVCWVWNDTAPLSHQGRAAFEFLPHTTDFVYLRLLGDLRTEFNSAGQRSHEYGRLLWSRKNSMENWCVKLARHMDTSREVLVFVSNHYEGMAPASCQRFAKMCGFSMELPKPESALQMNLL